jgi:putative pyruvate formate lyase activating enzyme
MGYCKVGFEPLVASVVLHMGEEPIISGKKGICNIFFAHCNLSCVFCQNHQISRNEASNNNWISDYEAITERVIDILNQGINIIGFVSPTHQVPQMVEIIIRLNSLGYHPTVVYNTNSYDNQFVLRELDGFVDVYLPDIKYYDNNLSNSYSSVDNYFIHALAAIKEMVWQRGTTIVLGDDGIVESGVVVRHLLIPGLVNDSIKIFKRIAEEIDTNISVSLMSQYYPSGIDLVNYNELNRSVLPSDYKLLVETIKELGFYKGWIQDLDSNNSYLPDFSKSSPF